MRFSQQQPGWLAITLDERQISLAHVVRPPAGKPRVAMLQSTPSGPHDDVDALARLRRTNGLQRYRCSTLLGAPSYQLVQVNTPAVPADEQKAALRWAVKDALDYPADEALIDVLSIPAGANAPGRPGLSFAVAARRDVVAQRVRAFQRAGLRLQVIDVAETAQRNIAALFETPGRALALLACHDNGGLLTFTLDGELFASRRIDIAASALTLDGKDDAPRRDAFFERIVLEMQRSLDSFDRQFGHIALQRLLVAAPPGAMPLIHHLASNLYCAVEALDLAAVLETEGCTELADSARQTAWLPAIGLALREVD